MQLYPKISKSINDQKNVSEKPSTQFSTKYI